MNRVIEGKLGQIANLCAIHHVRRLELFGSAARDGFDAQISDVDFLVEFEPLSYGQHAECYFGLLFGLEDLLGQPVDLVSERAIRNPYFRQSVDATRRLIYASGSQEISV